MSAQRHLTDASEIARRQALDIQSLIDATRMGHHATDEQLRHLQRQATAIFYALSAATVALGCVEERRRLEDHIFIGERV